MSAVPPLRIRRVNAAPVRAGRGYVLYWMIAARRAHWNFGLDRALEWARELDRPLVVLEALRCDYDWACDRLHRFVMEGMDDNAAAFARAGVLHYSYLEPRSGAAKGLLRALAKEACVVVTDDFPCFFLPRMVAAAGRRLKVLLEAVDTNGLVPLAAPDREFATAASLREWLRKNLHHHLEQFPDSEPLKRLRLAKRQNLPAGVRKRWPSAKSLARLPIDHEVEPVASKGGPRAARRALKSFLNDRLARYPAGRIHPDRDGGSGLSPWLHFGHLSVHEVFSGVAAAGETRAAEPFLDQLITWRELGYQFCARHADHDRFESLPAWARRTLGKHARDRRPWLYSPSQLENAETQDALWNAAQVQLTETGTIHGALRRFWGKKVLEWTRSPREALEVLIHFNNQYALEGRDPSSYTGILGCLGRFEEPSATERPVYGTVPRLHSRTLARKLRLKAYLRRYAP